MATEGHNVMFLSKFASNVLIRWDKDFDKKLLQFTNIGKNKNNIDELVLRKEHVEFYASEIIILQEGADKIVFETS